jgi:hypothetical protein
MGNKIGGLTSAGVAICRWFYRGDIEAFIFEKVVTVTDSSSQLLSE